MSAAPFPTVLSSSLIGNPCPRYFHFSQILNRAPATPNIHLLAGGAFAAGCDAYRRSYWSSDAPGDHDTALAHAILSAFRHYGEPSDESDPSSPFAYPSPKSAIRIAIALVAYFDHFHPSTDFLTPLTLNDRIATEYSFTFELPIKHPDTSDPLLYSGRIDLLADYRGTPFIVDEKTTSSLGQQWRRQWSLRPQFSGYALGCRATGVPVAGAIVRGVGLLKNDITFDSVITYRPDWMIDEWLAHTITTIEGLIQCYRTANWPAAHGHLCTNYSGCIYESVCTTRPETRIAFLESSFPVSHYDPLTGNRTFPESN